MCFFDKNPIWREIDSELVGPIEECSGKAEDIYYISVCVIHFYLLLEFILRVLMEKYQLKFLTTLESIIEIFTTIPFLIFYFSFERSSYIVQLFIMFDQARLLLFKRYTKRIDGVLRQELLNIALSLVALCWIMALFIQFVENINNYQNDPVGGQTFTFWGMFFFTITTASTVGYGSSIVSPQGRIALSFMIAFLVYYFPESCTRMVQLYNAKSRYARFEYKQYSSVPHVVVIGTISQTSMKNFLSEYFHDDHGDHQRHCVLMQPCRPSADTEILMSHKYVGKLFYVEGTTQE